MQACSLEPAEDLVARIEMEKQPTVNKPPQTLSEDLDTIQQAMTLSSFLYCHICYLYLCRRGSVYHCS